MISFGCCKSAIVSLSHTLTQFNSGAKAQKVPPTGFLIISSRPKVTNA